jgi:hypothetical protein
VVHAHAEDEASHEREFPCCPGAKGKCCERRTCKRMRLKSLILDGRRPTQHPSLGGYVLYFATEERQCESCGCKELTYDRCCPSSKTGRATEGVIVKAREAIITEVAMRTMS